MQRGYDLSAVAVWQEVRDTSRHHLFNSSSSDLQKPILWRVKQLFQMLSNGLTDVQTKDDNYNDSITMKI